MSLTLKCPNVQPNAENSEPCVLQTMNVMAAKVGLHVLKFHDMLGFHLCGENAFVQ